MVENVSLLHQELVACGLYINGCGSDGNVQISSRPTCPEGEEAIWVDPTDELVVLVLAAHSNLLSSDECLALQAAITNEQWLAYQECRKNPVRALRAERYKNETDALFMKTFEDSTRTEDGDLYILKVPKTNFDAWTSGKQTIREALPYPD